MPRSVDLRAAIADHSSASSLAAKFRNARWSLLLRRFPNFQQMRVLDLGGTMGAWQAAPVRPQHVTLVNLSPEDGPVDERQFAAIEGDACDPPPELRSQRFDLVYSNSAIEHLGGHARRNAFAQLWRRLPPITGFRRPTDIFR